MCCLAFVEVHSRCLCGNVNFETQECFVKATNNATCNDNKKYLGFLCQNANLIVRNSHQPTKWEEHLFASPLQSLEGCVQRGFKFVHVPKKEDTAIIL